MPRPPNDYSKLLGEKMSKHGASAWLVNTGWNGGPYGQGERISIAYTRAIVAAILDGKLSSATTREDPVFGIAVPTECPDVPAQVLQPRSTWKDPQAYDEKARHLVQLFTEHFAKYEEFAAELQTAGPRSK